MSKKMMKGSGALLCLAVLFLPGRAIGQDETQVAQETYQVAQLTYQAATMEDTIYRAARRALNESQYRRAIELFEQSLDEEPKYSAEALYYQALSYYRMGGRSNYDRALAKLDAQMERYPDAASYGDAEELMVRIEGELARRGDAQAAERLAREAERLGWEADQEAEHAAQEAARDAGRGGSREGDPLPVEGAAEPDARDRRAPRPGRVHPRPARVR